jgi:hypothetical protein
MTLMSNSKVGLGLSLLSIILLATIIPVTTISLIIFLRHRSRAH